MLIKALADHKKRIKTDRFTLEEVAIRDHFDRFFSYFERFSQFISAGIFTAEELSPYVEYWLDKISIDLEPGDRDAILKNIEIYKFEGTNFLLNLYNLRTN